MKIIVSCDVQLAVRLLDNNDVTVLDFNSFNEAVNMANFHKMNGDEDVLWIDEHVTFDDGSVFQDRCYDPNFL